MRGISGFTAQGVGRTFAVMSMNAPAAPAPIRSTVFTHALLILTGIYAILAVIAHVLASQAFAAADEADCPGLDLACGLAPVAGAVAVWVWYGLAVLLSMLALALAVFPARIRSAPLASGIAVLIGLALPPLALVVVSVLG